MNRILLLLLISGLLNFNTFISASLSRESSDVVEEEYDEDLDEDLTFLLKQANEEEPESSSFDEEEEENDEEKENETKRDVDEEEVKPPLPEIDEKDVVILKRNNFTSFVTNNRYVLVQFFVTRCVPCEAIAREFAAAATELNGEAVFAKVNATEEKKLVRKYEVNFLPMLLFFADGLRKPYSGQKIKDAIVSWVKKRTGPGVFNITTLEDAEHTFNVENKFVVGFLDSLEGPDSEQLSAASRRDDDLNFYQTDNPDVAKFFHIDPNAKRPALVIVKKDDQDYSLFDGRFTKSAILKFAKENKSPLVVPFARENAALIFESKIKKQIFLFGTSKSTKEVFPIFQEAAKHFKGKLIFVYVDLEQEMSKDASQYFGIKGDSPQVRGFLTETDEGKKYKLEDVVSLDSIKVFGEQFVGDKLNPFFNSDPIPVTNNGDVKIVVGNNFDEIILDESKDVLLEVYSPSCSRCQALEPTYNKLAKHFRGIDSLVIAKMDGTSNDHPSVKVSGVPMFLFYPAGNKNRNPVNVQNDHTVVGLYKFLKKNAKIPFRLKRPTSSVESEETLSTNALESDTINKKDEL